MVSFEIILFVITALISPSYGKSKETVIICENSKQTISCRGGEVLEITSANYGRTSSKFCPTTLTNQNTKCKTPHTLSLLKRTCDNKVSCVLESSNSVFGDPCVNTYKYLEVVYTCKASRSSGSLQVPEWAYFWRDYKGRTPDDALVLATTRDHDKIYGGHANIYCRGNIVHQINSCAKEVLVPLNGAVKTTKNLQILCTSQNHLFEWRSVTATDYSSIKHPWTWFIAGDQNNSDLGICKVQEGSIIYVGKVLQKQCHYIRNNQECVATSFKILVIKMLVPPNKC